ncbi:hypothetical protein HDU78_001666 [Chytriomyces hyalinus]|nr:hypothetical protein HDU78_001666 [Chytriomyces hyalinus]
MQFRTVSETIRGPVFCSRSRKECYASVSNSPVSQDSTACLRSWLGTSKEADAEPTETTTVSSSVVGASAHSAAESSAASASTSASTPSPIPRHVADAPRPASPSNSRITIISAVKGLLSFVAVPAAPSTPPPIQANSTTANASSSPTSSSSPDQHLHNLSAHSAPPGTPAKSASPAPILSRVSITTVSSAIAPNAHSPTTSSPTQKTPPISRSPNSELEPNSQFPTSADPSIRILSPLPSPDFDEPIAATTTNSLPASNGTNPLATSPVSTIIQATASAGLSSDSSSAVDDVSSDASASSVSPASSLTEASNIPIITSSMTTPVVTETVTGTPAATESQADPEPLANEVASAEKELSDEPSSSSSTSAKSSSGSVSKVLVSGAVSVGTVEVVRGSVVCLKGSSSANSSSVTSLTQNQTGASVHDDEMVDEIRKLDTSANVEEEPSKQADANSSTAGVCSLDSTLADVGETGAGEASDVVAISDTAADQLSGVETNSQTHIAEEVEISQSITHQTEASIHNEASLAKTMESIQDAIATTLTVTPLATQTAHATKAVAVAAEESSPLGIPKAPSETSIPDIPAAPAPKAHIKRLQFRLSPSLEDRKRMTRLVVERCRPLFFPVALPTSPTSAAFPAATPQPHDAVTAMDMTLSVISTASNSSTAPVMTVRVPASTANSRQFLKTEFQEVAAACGLPKHVGFALHRRIVERGWMQLEELRDAMGVDGGDKIALAAGGDVADEFKVAEDGEDRVGWEGFERFLQHVFQFLNPDMEALVYELLKPSDRDYLVPLDFRIVVEDLLQTHPAFEFLASSPAFQARFTETVIARLFYLCPRNGRNRMDLRDFRLTNITTLFREVETATNSLGNNIPSVFSYKDFYVIYCKFWELDRDRDMLLTIYDLELYGRRALSHAALARIMECYGITVVESSVEDEGAAVAAVERGDTVRCLGYKEFIAFILSVEEKTSDSALDYWFRVLDLDGDGVLSLLELETFWEHQHMRLPEQYTVFDFFSLILDLIRPSATSLTLMDLKRNRNAAVLFLDFLLDSRKHIENIRRSTDVGFRLRDEIWAEEEDESNKKKGEEMDGLMELEAAVKRYKLEGWAKYSERAYRELSAPVEVDSADDLDDEVDEPVYDNSPSLQTGKMKA